MIKKFFKKINLFSRSSLQRTEDESEYHFKWYEIGEDNNPFNKKVLDIRRFTHAVTSVSKGGDQFDFFRKSDGFYLKESDTTQFKTVHCHLLYRGENWIVPGMSYKSQAMEIKWDIYYFDDFLYFSSSWTGELKFKAHIIITETGFKIDKIQYLPNALLMLGREDSEIAINCVHFLILSHVMGKVVPCPCSKLIPDDEPRLIAYLSFKMFGNLAHYATKESILDITVWGKEV